MDSIYLDHSATTPVDQRVVEKMLPYYSTHYGNASSIHSLGQKAKDDIEIARAHMAALINASPDEIIFTSGGTESDNLAIRGAFLKLSPNGKNHIITTKIEHHAILHTVEDLVKNYGATATYLDVDSDGLINLEQLKSAITDKTCIVSVMAANNELGTIQPMEEIGKICKEKGVWFHTDAVQAAGKMEFDVEKFSISMASFSAHKFYGPKGVGALYIKKGINIKPIYTGGGHEKGIRPGTYNTPGIVGMGEAARLAKENFDDSYKHTKELRDYLEKRISEEIKYVGFNGSRTNRLPQVASISFRYVEGESILMFLDMEGNIQASSGSACTAGDLHASHVLLAISLPHEICNSTLRFSFGKDNTKEQVDKVMEILPGIIERLRKMSPIAPKENE
ncbi:MAG TPA: cysteine desulfurase family protein [Caldisericia bacterium]|nr:cysteine desulfurase family protein [Caldisericia bacterium]HPF49212.1 cysteine desulfurase family protein [Caldisericia bacterium]HPI84108.1 cysteine desulfurase family protein [Caldisericia bacterium]HPQ93366.1 cysteine desulfurase family protein [Caldisericia bacterium]HRV75252.1 cysteine desulfurase family protein [Caldisericia bacterium]